MPELPVNASLSTITPGLQLAWDSTSLGALKECPRKYQLSILQGWAPRVTSVHLVFGILYHESLERYDRAKAKGASHDEATIAAVRYALTASWDKELNRPRAVLSQDPNKNRFTLVRTVVWYLDRFAEDSLKTIILENDEPAVELSFRFELEVQSTSGEAFLACGHMDRLVELDGRAYVSDRKTTKNTISPSFVEKFSPHNQFSMYQLATKIVYHKETHGLIVDMAQIAVTFSRFARGLVERSAAQLEEYYRDTVAWIKLAEGYARANHWPMNDTACDHYGGCPFRRICSKNPSVRDDWLRKQYHRRVWDPLKVRGDF